MTEITEKELGEKLAALCSMAKTDATLRQRLLSDTISALNADGIQIPSHLKDRVVAFVSAALFELERTQDQ